MCDSKEEEEVIIDMRKFNARGNTENILYKICWDYCARALEFENGDGAHFRIYARTKWEKNNNAAHVPGVASISQLSKKIIEMLNKHGKVQVPCKKRTFSTIIT